MENQVKVHSSKRKKIQPSQIALHIVIIILFALGLYPLFMALWCSFKSGGQYLDNMWLPTLPLRLENIGVAFEAVKDYMLNTVIVAVAATVGMLAVSSMAGFAMAKLQFFGSKILLAVVLGLNMMPGVLTLVPSYMLYHSLNLTDTLPALIIPPIFGTSSVFLIYNSFKSLPNSIFEAAELDGANDFQKYLLIAMPLAFPILATLAIMQISGTWSDFGWPQLVMSRENYTIAAGLKAEFFNITSADSMPVSFAAYLLASLPLIILFFFTNKVYVEGLVSSGLKL